MGKEEPNGFAEFWTAYPRKEAKIDAMKAYKAVLRLTTSDEILYAAQRYAEQRMNEDKQFTKLPAGWLRAGRWGDYRDAEETAALVDQQMNGLVYVSFADPALEAWVRWELANPGKGRHRCKDGGGFFPTRWPPGHQEQAA